jgi:hypothetical protein
MFLWDRRQQFVNVYLVTNADKYKYYERWATANDFPVENIINDGTTGYETRFVHTLQQACKQYICKGYTTFEM